MVPTDGRPIRPGALLWVKSGSHDLAESAREWRETVRAAAQLADPADQRRLLIDQSASLDIVTTCEMMGFPIYGSLDPAQDDGARPLAWLVVLAASIGAIAAGRQQGRTASAVRSALTGLVAGSILFHVAASVVAGVWLQTAFTDLLAVEVGVLPAIQSLLLDGELAFASLVVGGISGTIGASLVAHRRRRRAANEHVSHREASRGG